jgi:hypothetical protein|eukprot:CAMPEP_0174375836 /NCGR_PEP_ID=MMETSP0811_2-20130205/115987_1 /TAXON_ID=73025 ORGANISM="Eutreptiella gymnastica-like, Strain CCMP1594" /NCGR_SAMPLE_ID=MMETSP0811_2 /ASSEMBLY_ACC=CAM_ASM_000667 /LENGTH=36 /DNA_ID= /DNA_START= /DNA_END= /DNA_ORIENTATION=
MTTREKTTGKREHRDNREEGMIVQTAEDQYAAQVVP